MDSILFDSIYNNQFPPEIAFHPLTFPLSLELDSKRK